MSRMGFLDWMLLASVGWCLAVAVVRAFVLRRGGVPVLVADRGRSPWQMAEDAVAAVCLLSWAYFVVAYATGCPPAWVPPAMDTVMWMGPGPHACGVLCLALAVVLHATSVLQLGTSWRIGIDRKAPGPLVTRGVYGWCRHPVYVALGLLFAGAALVVGRVALVVLGIAMGVVLETHAVREERFLSGACGDAYREYCSRVGRWWPLRRG